MIALESDRGQGQKGPLMITTSTLLTRQKERSRSAVESI
jgi:hypothetical protein